MGYTWKMILRLLAALALAAILAACGGGGNTLPTGPSPVATSVSLQYVAAVASEPEASQSLDCSGQIRVYPSWWGYAQVTMVPTAKARWGLLFEEVPIGAQRLNVVTPEDCAGGTLAANGIPLVAADDGFTFTLHPDGSVTR